MIPYKNYIYEYHAKITSGEIIAGKWIKQIYKIIVDALEKQEYFFNAKAANKAIKFIENFCHHSKGRNDLLKLELWQKAIVSVIFGVQDEEKIRIFREIFIVIGRKNGKSLFASAIIAYMAFLEPEYGQEIYCLAPKLDQAALVYDGFHKMVLAEPELEELAKKRRSDIYIEESNTFVKPIAFNAKKSDGFNPQLVVCDEMAAWSGDAGLKQYEVMKSALGARTQPMILSISKGGSTEKYVEVYPHGRAKHGNDRKGDKSNVRYATIGFVAEYGTSSQQARPYMTVANEKAQEKVVEAQLEIWERETNG